MNVDVVLPVRGLGLDLPPWSPAESLDLPLADGLVLRALVCRFEPEQWQWSISSINGEVSGQLICSGTTQKVAEARRIAVSEIGKCLTSAIATSEFAR